MPHGTKASALIVSNVKTRKACYQDVWSKSKNKAGFKFNPYHLKVKPDPDIDGDFQFSDDGVLLIKDEAVHADLTSTSPYYVYMEGVTLDVRDPPPTEPNVICPCSGP